MPQTLGQCQHHGMRLTQQRMRARQIYRIVKALLSMDWLLVTISLSIKSALIIQWNTLAHHSYSDLKKSMMEWVFCLELAYAKHHLAMWFLGREICTSIT